MSSGGGGVHGSNFQFLMLSSNLLKSKISMSGWVGGEGRGEVGGTNFQLLMLSPNLLKSKISHVRWGGEGEVYGSNFQVLMLSSSLLKYKIPMSGGGGGSGGEVGLVEPTFDAEFKFAKIQNSYVW